STLLMSEKMAIRVLITIPSGELRMRARGSCKKHGERINAAARLRSIFSRNSDDVRSFTFDLENGRRKLGRAENSTGFAERILKDPRWHGRIDVRRHLICLPQTNPHRRRRNRRTRRRKGVGEGYCKPGACSG